MRRRNKQLSLVLVLAFAAFFIPAHVAAATVPRGISLSPFEQNITFSPGEAVQSFNLTLTNDTPTVQELDLSVHDFGSLNDTGGIVIEGSNSYTEHYGLASWISLGTDTVILAPHQSRLIPVTVENRQDLAPGGHYGAVVATVNNLDTNPGNKVVLNQQLVSLILVDKQGGEHYDMRLDSIATNGNWFRLPTTVQLRFQDSGNVQVVPRGIVQLLGPTGGVISQGTINSDSDFVLPETYREIYVPLTVINRADPWPGVYRIRVLYRYDGINVTASRTESVRYLSLGTFIILLILFVIVWRIVRSRRAHGRQGG